MNDSQPRLGRLGKVLGFLLLFVLVCTAVLSASVVAYVHASGMQRALVQRIEGIGGDVRYDIQLSTGINGETLLNPHANSPYPRWLVDHLGEDFFHTVQQVEFIRFPRGAKNASSLESVADEALDAAGKLPRVRRLFVSGAYASDASFVHIPELEGLEELYVLDAHRIGDQGVQRLAGLKELKVAQLDFANISDSAMRVFAKLPKLEELSVQGNDFSNEAMKLISASPTLKSLMMGQSHGKGRVTVDDLGLAYVSRLGQLEELGLQGSRITNDGLIHLQELSHLKLLLLDGTDVDGLGLLSLQQKLPGPLTAHH